MTSISIYTPSDCLRTVELLKMRISVLSPEFEYELDDFCGVSDFDWCSGLGILSYYNLFSVLENEQLSLCGIAEREWSHFALFAVSYIFISKGHSL